MTCYYCTWTKDVGNVQEIIENIDRMKFYAEAAILKSGPGIVWLYDVSAPSLW